MLPKSSSPDVLRARSILARLGVSVATAGWIAGSVAAAVAAEHRLTLGLDGFGQLVTLTASFALWPLLLLAGWWWSRWVRSVATVALSVAPVADPRWQGDAYWAAGLQWWAPRRHLRRLAELFGAPDVRLVTAWWLSWVGFRLAAYLAIWQLWAPPRLTLPGWVAWPAMLVQLAAGILAITLVTRLSRVAGSVEVTSPDRWFEPEAGPRTGLLVELGVVFRLVTPGLVLGLFSILGALVH